MGLAFVYEHAQEGRLHSPVVVIVRYTAADFRMITHKGHEL